MTELCSECNKNVKKVNSDEFYESWSSTQIQVVKIRHTWTINNFSLCSQEKGKKLISPTFSAIRNNSEKLEWFLTLNLKGDSSEEDNEEDSEEDNDEDSEEGSDDVSLYLNLVEGSRDEVRAKFTFILKGQEKTHKRTSTSALFKSGKNWGWKHFISQKNLFDKENKYLLDDKLTIFCEIITGVSSKNFSGTLATPQRDLRFDFTFLLENEYLSDVILSADGKEFPAHKAILAAQCPIFRAMFQHGIKESKNNRVKITDIDKESLGEMLRYMYTGKINKLEEMAPRLLDVAEKYELDDLQIICENALLKILSLENVVEIFILSDKFAAIELKNHVKKFIAANGEILGNSPEFQSIFRTRPALAIEAFCALYSTSCRS